MPTQADEERIQNNLAIMCKLGDEAADELRYRLTELAGVDRELAEYLDSLVGKLMRNQDLLVGVATSSVLRAQAERELRRDLINALPEGVVDKVIAFLTSD